MPPCPLCARPLAVLGQSGRLAWLGCRACGAVVYGEEEVEARADNRRANGTTGKASRQRGRGKAKVWKPKG